MEIEIWLVELLSPTIHQAATAKEVPRLEDAILWTIATPS